jgi:hypothetical protein
VGAAITSPACKFLGRLFAVPHSHSCTSKDVLVRCVVVSVARGERHPAVVESLFVVKNPFTVRRLVVVGKLIVVERFVVVRRFVVVGRLVAGI